MKRITTLSILIILIFPFIFSSCKEEEEFGKDFWVGIPSSGTYFKIQVDDMIWEGDDFMQMYAKKGIQGDGSSMLDLVVCTDIENMINTVKRKVYIYVKVNTDGSFSNYRVQYIKNKSKSPYGSYFDFEEWMEYRSGSLKIIKNEGGKITAKFTGKLRIANNLRADANVIIYFQEFPIQPEPGKSLE